MGPLSDRGEALKVLMFKSEYLEITHIHKIKAILALYLISIISHHSFHMPTAQWTRYV